MSIFQGFELNKVSCLGPFLFIEVSLFQSPHLGVYITDASRWTLGESLIPEDHIETVVHLQTLVFVAYLPIKIIHQFFPTTPLFNLAFVKIRVHNQSSSICPQSVAVHVSVIKMAVFMIS